MNTPEQLLKRLEEIGGVLSEKVGALALIGLGSAGIEQDRLDQYSDLDFFVIVKNGSKDDYLQDLGWLAEIAPIVFSFANTPDGYKLLYEDGIFCEFAVFDENELKEAAFSPGRVIWKAEGVSDQIGCPQRTSERKKHPSPEWLIGEALTNLYVGLSRELRGEKLSAMRFIQGYAVDRVLELTEGTAIGEPTTGDEFSFDRRFEQHFPTLASVLPQFLQGYGRNCESALALLSYLDQNFEINPAMKQAVLELCRQKI